MKIKINKELPDYVAGTVVPVETDAEGIPLQRFWRDRLRDAETDNCIEILKPDPKPATKKQASEE